MSYILALDQGTTSSRAVLFDHAGRVVSFAQKEFGQHFPQPGWVEHDPLEIWSSQAGVALEALTLAGVRASEVAAIGLTNQRETTLLWDRKTGEPLHHAVVWQDRRTAPLCETLRQGGLEPNFQAKTGLLLDPYFSGTKLAWLLEHVPGARQRAEQGELCFGTVDSWLLFKLTDGACHVTDPSNASRTLLYNIHTGGWDPELLGLLNIPAALLPEVRSSSEVYAHTFDGLFGARIPIAGIAGDQQAATFGQVCLKPGMVKNTYGTGCFMLLNTGSTAKVSSQRLLTTVGWRRAGATTYALEGSVFMAGAAVGWLRDGLKIIAHSSDVESLALSVPDSGGVYLVPAFTGLGAPYWDPYARGSIQGLSRGSTGGHIARATLEGIAFQVADVLDAMRRDADVPLLELRVDGGASSNDLLMQFQADVLGLEVVRPRITETSALGAAYLAGLAVGFWESEAEIAAQWQVGARFTPKMPAGERDAKLERWHEAVKRSRAWEQG